MEHIVKKIMLDELQTKYPLTYPAIKNGAISYISRDNLLTNTNANYRGIPFGINEAICGPYNEFSAEMGETYSGKVLSYVMIEEWYREFIEYYNLLYSRTCNSPYSSATDYYISTYGIEYSGTSDYYSYVEMDDNFELHGGEKFYKWLRDNYFISLNLKKEYYVAKDDGVDITITYTEWMSILNNISSEIMYYPDVVELYNKLHALHDKYGDTPDCSKFDDCCECVEYLKQGGYNTCLILQNWIEKENELIGDLNDKVEEYQDKLMPSATITLPLKKKVEDFGNFSIFSTDYVLGKEYNIGNVCNYSGNTYILTSGNGYIIDEDGIYKFDKEGWRSYYEYCKEKNPEEYMHYDKDYLISGQTISSLDYFTYAASTLDNMGNALPGHYEFNSGSTFSQPAEDTILDIIYELGRTNNETYSSGGTYNGNVLMALDLFFCNTSGTPIESTIIHCSEGDDILSSITQCIEKASLVEDIDSTLHGDFTYYKNTNYSYDEDGKISLNMVDVSGESYWLGVKCVEHCTFELKTCIYWLTSTENYTVRYYDITKNIEEKYSDEYDKFLNVAIADCYISPYIYDNDSNVAAPGFRKEELLGYSLPENLQNNIYIDRGYNAVMDKFLRIGEITSFDTLSQYGNGLFNLINLEEENI